MSPEVMAKLMGPKTKKQTADRQAIYDLADANGDGLLNKAEYFAYQTASYEYGKAQFGNSPQFSKKESAILYDATNSLNKEHDGVNMDDMAKMVKVSMIINAP